MPNELKPCPFCGEIPKIMRDGFGYFKVKCTNVNCNILCTTMPCAREEYAIENWNRRVDNA